MQSTLLHSHFTLKNRDEEPADIQHAQDYEGSLWNKT